MNRYRSNPSRGALLILCVFICALIGLAARHQPVSRDSTVNDCLNTVLEVGSEWSAGHRHFTWGEMDAEVARRMRVKRVRVWEGGR